MGDQHRRICRLGLPALLIVGWLLLAGTLPAAAQEAPEQHCVLQVAPAGMEAPPAEPHCYPSFSAAIHAATGGRVTLNDDAARAELSDELLNAPASPVIYGIDYREPNYGGDSYIMVSNYGGCGPERSYELPFYPRPWWNDAVSSTQAFAGCTLNKLYPDIWWQGVGITCTPDCATLGDMDNRASSRQWCAAGAPCPARPILDNAAYLPLVSR